MHRDCIFFIYFIKVIKHSATASVCKAVSNNYRIAAPIRHTGLRPTPGALVQHAGMISFMDYFCQAN